jgi:hypothetical protein
MTQAYHPKFPQTLVGSLYPTNYIVAVFDDLRDARQAARAFYDSGYEENTVRVMDARETLARIEQLDAQKNPFQRFFSSFQGATDETGAQIYRFEATQGHHMLYVRACASSIRTCSTREIGQIRAILKAHRAHTVKFFGTWAVEDIPLLP